MNIKRGQGGDDGCAVYVSPGPITEDGVDPTGDSATISGFNAIPPLATLARRFRRLPVSATRAVPRSMLMRRLAWLNELLRL